MEPVARSVFDIFPDHYSLSKAAADLHEQGYARISPVSTLPAGFVQEEFAQIVDTFGVTRMHGFTFEVERRPDGREDPDDGLLYQPEKVDESGKVIQGERFLLHYRPELESLIMRQGLGMFHEYDLHVFTRMVGLVRDMQNVHQYYVNVVLAIAYKYDTLYVRGKRDASLVGEILHALKRPSPTSRTVSRVLCFPLQSAGARSSAHVDRGCLTLFAADRGGELFIRHPDGREENVSPGMDEVLVFWGLKGEMFGKRHDLPIKAVVHGSHALEDGPRTAMATFVHTNDIAWDAPRVRY